MKELFNSKFRGKHIITGNGISENVVKINVIIIQLVKQLKIKRNVQIFHKRNIPQFGIKNSKTSHSQKIKFSA